MGQILHGSARTTEAVRRAIQSSQESLRALAKRYGVNQKTVAKWKKQSSVRDERTGPKDPHSTVLSLEDEAIIVAFRKHTLLPLDDCLYALQATILRQATEGQSGGDRREQAAGRGVGLCRRATTGTKRRTLKESAAAARTGGTAHVQGQLNAFQGRPKPEGKSRLRSSSAAALTERLRRAARTRRCGERRGVSFQLCRESAISDLR